MSGRFEVRKRAGTNHLPSPTCPAGSKVLLSATQGPNVVLAKGKRLVRVFSYPDKATDTKTYNLVASLLAVGVNQADWLDNIDTTGEIIYGYEVTATEGAMHDVETPTVRTSETDVSRELRARMQHPSRWQTSESAAATPDEVDDASSTDQPAKEDTKDVSETIDP